MRHDYTVLLRGYYGYISQQSDNLVHAKITSMRIGLIGATGFVGGYLVDALLGAAYEPSVLVRPGSEDKLPRADECRVTQGDLSSDVAIAAVLDGCEAVIYNVGLLREFPGKGITFEEAHFRAAARVIDATRDAGISRFLLMSANGVKRPGTPYQETKLQAEEYLRESGLDYTIFRPSVIFGDPQGKMEIATQLYKEMIRLPLPAVGFYSGPIPPGRPVLMSPVHVRDVADAFVSAVEDVRTFGKRYDIGGPEALSWQEMLRRIAQSVGKRKMILPMPIGFMKVGATLFDWLPSFPATRDQLTMLAEGNTADPTALVKLIGRPPQRFAPGNLEYLGQGIDTT